MACFGPLTERGSTWTASISSLLSRPDRRSKEIPKGIFTAKCHTMVDQISREVDGYFLEHWPFPDTRSRKKFVAAGFSRVTCLYFPLSKNDRIGHACRLLTLLFLIDDMLEHMSFDEGAAYNNNLMPLARGIKKPDWSVPAEYIMYELWHSMRLVDEKMANDILEPTFEFMRAQTDKSRSTTMGLAEYFHYRERDVGRGLLSALQKYCMGTHLTKDEAEQVREIDMNCSKHLSVVNDIWSFEKELATAKVGHEEGGVLCNSVAIVSEEASISVPAAKRILYALCREWELRHVELTSLLFRRCDSAAIKLYVKGLEYQMSGNEAWSRTTSRYQ